MYSVSFRIDIIVYGVKTTVNGSFPSNTYFNRGEKVNVIPHGRSESYWVAKATVIESVPTNRINQGWDIV